MRRPGSARWGKVRRRRATRGLSPAVVAAVLRRPRLWPVALRSVRRMAPPGWHRRRPYLPVPAPGYLGFRLETMYGSADHRPEPADLVRWLEWCRDQMTDRPLH